MVGKDRREYLKLAVRELKCGKLRLRPLAKAVANVFAAPKSTKGRQRKIWDGARISDMAALPPKPSRLANPSSFLDLLVLKGEKLFMSKRDASTYFDSLRVPEPLQPWFGQQPVYVQEILDMGIPLSQVEQWSDDLSGATLTGDTLLYPVNVVWPMGFSWSPCIAQATTIGCVKRAGVEESNILSMDDDLPLNQDELCAVATDDVLFSTSGRSRA